MVRSGFLISCLLFFSSEVFSQQDENTQPSVSETANSEGSSSASSSPEQNVASEKKDSSEVQESSNNQSDYRVFKPSEEISEDLTVPFPTDI